MRIHRLNSSILTVILGLTITTIGFQNCAKAKFAIDEAAKEKALGDVSVFEPGDDANVPGGRNTPGDDANVPGGGAPGDDGAQPRPGGVPGDDGAMPRPGSTPRIPTVPGFPTIPGMPQFPNGNDPQMPGGSPMPGMTPINGNDPQVPGSTPRPGTSPTPVSGNDPQVPAGVPVPGDDSSTTLTNPLTIVPSAVCGPELTQGQASLPSAAKVSAVLYKLGGSNLVLGGTAVQAWDTESDMAALKSKLTSMKEFKLSTTSKLAAGYYAFVLYDAAKVKKPYKLDPNNSKPAVAPILDSVASMMEVNSLFEINAQGKQSRPQVMNVYVGNTGDAICKTAGVIDPLLIQLKTSKPQPIELSAPADGVMFDLLGRRHNHVPVKTAWFTNPNTENYYLVLPNKNGLVLGIDELFGDATTGPDGKFAQQGFAALAKYDDNKDKMISEDDEVFSKLRLWKDSNLDGVAQSSELFSLDEKEVVAIDLRFDRRFQEMDKHGNMTRFKSVVVMKDGSYSLVYDLWLRFLGR